MDFRILGPLQVVDEDRSLSLGEARDELDQVLAAELPFDQEWLYAMSLLAEACPLTGDADTAALLYVPLEPWGAFNAVDTAEGFRGSVARYLGLLAVTAERRPDAKRHFEDALAHNAQIGALPWLARTQQDYASLLLSRNGAGDDRRASELLAAAAGICREVGMETPSAI